MSRSHLNMWQKLYRWGKTPAGFIGIAAVVIAIIGIIVTITIAIFFPSTKPLSPVPSLIENNSASSQNQTGGITAGKVVIQNGQTPRHLNPENKKQLDDFFQKNEKLEIQVFYSSNSNEAYQYASEIKEYLESQNLNVNSFLGAFTSFDPPTAGVQVSKYEEGHQWHINVNQIQ